MRFSLIDRIVVLQPGSHIEAIKALAMAEEYLADHFPGFPVLPGVLMLESMTQAAAWLVRASEDFAHSMVLLKEAKNVKYGQFVQPGQILRVSAEVVSETERETVLKARGEVEGETTVRGQLVLERFNLAERGPQGAVTDRLLRDSARSFFGLLWNGASGEAASAGAPSRSAAPAGG